MSERWEASKEKSQFDIRVKSLSADHVCVTSSSAEFLLSSLDVYSIVDAESSDPSSRNDEPMTRGKDRQESAEIKGLVDMQSALLDCHISSSSPTDETAYKIQCHLSVMFVLTLSLGLGNPKLEVGSGARK